MLTVTSIDASAGGILIVDGDCRPYFSSDEMFHALNVALDPQGKTELVFHYPGESWDDVWKREPELLWGLCRAKRAIVLLVPEGEHTVALLDEDPPPAWGLPEPADFSGALALTGEAIVAGLDDLVFREAGIATALTGAMGVRAWFDRVATCPASIAIQFRTGHQGPVIDGRWGPNVARFGR